LIGQRTLSITAFEKMVFVPMICELMAVDPMAFELMTF
jgi:hypothetical protein